MHEHERRRAYRRIRDLVCAKCGGIIGIQCDGTC
jgi:hypothetical protein